MYNEKLDYEINGKKIQIPLAEIKVLQHNLELTLDEAIQTWLDDNDYTTNEVVEELTKKAKDNKTTLVGASDKTKRKPREKVQKENPTKELIIAEIAKSLQALGVQDLKIENKAKLITFNYANESFKVDLVQKRKPKA